MSNDFKNIELIMNAFTEWTTLNPEKYKLLDSSANKYYIFGDDNSFDLASASQTKNGYYVTINCNKIIEKSLSQLVVFFEHEMTHLTEGTLKKSIEFEYRAWSAEFELLEKVYGDLNPYKNHRDYIAWKTLSKEEFTQYLRKEYSYYH